MKLVPDILRPLTNQELYNLIELYKRRGDKYHCMSIYNHCHWISQLACVNADEDHNNKWGSFKRVYFTNRNGNLATNGTYISLQWDRLLSIQFHTLEESLSELKECILKTKLINWSSGPLLTAIDTNFTDKIIELLAEVGVAVEHKEHCTCLILPRNDALQIQIPSMLEGYQLRELQGKHANLIHDKWPHKGTASVDFIRGMITLNRGMGVFRLKDENPVAWIIQNEFYGIGLLQVVPEEQGKGFAKLLTKALSKEIAHHDEKDIPAFVAIDNMISESIVTKIGYRKNCITTWIQLKNYRKY